MNNQLLVQYTTFCTLSQKWQSLLQWVYIHDDIAMMNPEHIPSYTKEDFYGTPTPEGKVEIAARFLGQDLAGAAREQLDDDKLFEFLRTFKA